MSRASLIPQDFSRVEEKFIHALELKPEVPAATLMLDCINDLDNEILEEDWDGAVKLKVK